MKNALLKNVVFDANYSVSIDRCNSFVFINRQHAGDVVNVMPGLLGPIHNILNDVDHAIQSSGYRKYIVTALNYVSGKSVIASKLRESAATDFILYGNEEKYQVALNRIDSLFNFEKFLLKQKVSIHTDLYELNTDWLTLKNKYNIDSKDLESMTINEKEYSIVFTKDKLCISLINPIGINTVIGESVAIDLIKHLEIAEHQENYLLFEGDLEIFQKAKEHAYRFMDFNKSMTKINFSMFCREIIETNHICLFVISQFIDFKNKDSKSEYGYTDNENSLTLTIQLPKGFSKNLFDYTYYSHDSIDYISIYLGYDDSNLVVNLIENILVRLNAYQSTPGRLALYFEQIHKSLVTFFDELIQYRKDVQNVDK